MQLDKYYSVFFADNEMRESWDEYPHFQEWARRKCVELLESDGPNELASITSEEWIATVHKVRDVNHSDRFYFAVTCYNDPWVPVKLNPAEVTMVYMSEEELRDPVVIDSARYNVQGLY